MSDAPVEDETKEPDPDNWAGSDPVVDLSEEATDGPPMTDGRPSVDKLSNESDKPGKPEEEKVEGRLEPR